MIKTSREIKMLAALLLPVILVLILHQSLTGFIIYNDGIGYYIYARSAVIDKDLDFMNEWKYYESQQSRFSNVSRGIEIPEIRTPKGLVDNVFLIGNAVMWLPFFLAAHAITLLLPLEANGYSILYELGIAAANLIYGFLGILLTYKFCRKWFGRKTSFFAVFAVWYGTAAFWFHSIEPSMAHTNSLFLGALFVYLWHDTLGKRTKLQWLALGALLGLMFLVRQQEILFGILIAFEFLKKLIGRFDLKQIKGIAAESAAFGTGLIAALIPQILAWRYLYGRFFVYSYGNINQYWNWTFPQLVPFLLSAESGVWRIPVLLASITGLFLFASRVKGVAWYFTAVVLADILLTISWTGWVDGYGIRFLIGMSVFFALGAAEIIERLRTRIGMKWVYAIFALLIAANFVNMLLFLLGEVTSKVPLSEIPRVLINAIL